MRKRSRLCILATLLSFAFITGCHYVGLEADIVPQTSSLPETMESAEPSPAATSFQTTGQTTSADGQESTTTGTTATETSSDGTTAATTSATTRRATQAATTAAINMDSPYYLYAEKGSFTLVVYGKDEFGKFTKVIRTIRMAIGRGTMTPKGRFKIGKKYAWHLYGDVYLPYACAYKSGLLIHGPIYSEMDHTTMHNASYTQIGTKATSGCLRIPIADAKWIFTNCPSGTTLDIVDGSPRGFVPPSLIPISISGQDPTDPDLAPAVTTTTMEPEISPTPTPEPETT